MGRLKYLLDTHAFVWAALDDERLSVKAGRAIATTPWEQLAISDVSLQEVGLLVASGRLRFTGSPAAALGSLLDFVRVLPITLEAALLAPGLRLPHGDQFDRIIAATAKSLRLTLITKDSNLTDSGIVPVLW